MHSYRFPRWLLLITVYRREMAVEVEKALEMNAVTCLEKPLDIPRLQAALDKLWQERLKKALFGL